MMPLTEILLAGPRDDTGFTAIVPDDWMQGRTAYGGLSGALALQAALELEPDLPPLRSAQIAFIGPLAGPVQVSATLLRRGRNSAFIQADVLAGSSLGLRATFVFMAAMESHAARDVAPRAQVAPPPPDARLYTGPDGYFTSNFNFFDLKDAAGEAEWLRWGRLRERTGLHPMVELVAIGDSLPPGAFKLYGKRGVPLSSLNWTINFLTPEPSTRDGWWLLNARTDTAHHGFSSQRMLTWNAAGEPMTEAMQSVAIFG